MHNKTLHIHIAVFAVVEKLFCQYNVHKSSVCTNLAKGIRHDLKFSDLKVNSYSSIGPGTPFGCFFIHLNANASAFVSVAYSGDIFAPSSLLPTSENRRTR